jgi:hypothetical protein
MKKRSSLALALILLLLLPSLSWAWSGKVIGVMARRKGLFTSEMRPSGFPKLFDRSRCWSRPHAEAPKKEHPPPIWASIDEGPLGREGGDMEVTLCLARTLVAPWEGDK